MVNLKSADFQAPSIQGRVTSWFNNGSLPPYLIVENLDVGASAAIKYQESDDGSTWSDVSGSSATVNPSSANGQLVVSSKAQLALSAGGNVRLVLSLVRQVNGVPASLGAA